MGDFQEKVSRDGIPFHGPIFAFNYRLRKVSRERHNADLGNGQWSKEREVSGPVESRESSH